jgi:hypothetical protein
MRVTARSYQCTATASQHACSAPAITASDSSPVRAHHPDERAEHELHEDVRVERFDETIGLRACDHEAREVLDVAIDREALGVEIRRVVVQLDERERAPMLGRERDDLVPDDLELLAR